MPVKLITIINVNNEVMIIDMLLRCLDVVRCAWLNISLVGNVNILEFRPEIVNMKDSSSNKVSGISSRNKVFNGINVLEI